MEKPTENTFFNISESKDFDVFIPKNFTERIDRSGNSIGYINYDKSTAKRNSNDYLVVIYQNDISINCSNDFVGFSKPQEKIISAKEKTRWGKIDYFDLYWTGDFPNAEEPICRPFGIGAAYAFCSEKNGKKVLLCIAKGTDDPKFADEIFSTFKWKN